MTSWIRNNLSRFLGLQGKYRNQVGEPGSSEQVLREMQACLRQTGGVLATRRRIANLVDQYARLDPEHRMGFVKALNCLDDAQRGSSDHYARLEETELFGRASSKLAIFATLEPPRRQMLTLLNGAKGGPELLLSLRQVADDELSTEINGVVSG